MSDIIVIKPAVQQQFDHFLQYGRILFFSAPCGFGKTALSEVLLAGKNVLSLTADERGVRLPDTAQGWEILLIDDFQYLQEDEEQKALCSFVRAHPDRRFVFLSRGVPPGWLSAFSYTGLMTVLDVDALLFDREDIRSLLQMQDISVSEADLTSIQKTTLGYPLAVCIAAKRMAAGSGFTQELVTQAYQELFRYFDAAVYRRFSLSVRRFLLEMAPFDSFDAELARVVSGNNDASAQLDWIQRNTTMLRYDGIHTFHFWPGFREFLLWEMDREYSGEMRQMVFRRGGLYYELRDDYPNALECYVRGDDHAKVSELLIRNAGLHPGMGHYLETARYYRSLPEREILASPALMQGMSMLCALSGDYDGSEKWYASLKQLAASCDKNDAAGREAKSRLVWLDISLPQRGIKDLAQTIPTVCRLLTQKELTLPPLGVTACLPSILNGGKDFSDWTKADNAIFRTLCAPAVAILGKDGVGLADCAAAESAFETGGDISSQMLTLLSRLNEIRNKGTPDVEFATVGLLARSQLHAGHPQDAGRLLCADKSNAEIGATLDIRLPTVKTHVSSILKKLGVSRRSEAKTAAQKLWLIP